MRQLVECVPNFSEGRNKDTIDAIGESIRNVPGAHLLSIEPDADYNRTVATFVGEPDAVEAARQRAVDNPQAMLVEHASNRRHRGIVRKGDHGDRRLRSLEPRP